MFKMKKSPIIAIAIAILATLWVASGVILPGHEDNAQSTPTIAQAEKQEQEEQTIQQVRVREIEAQSHSHDIILTGRSIANKRIDLRTEVSGQITHIHFERGDTVKSGDILAEIEVNDRSAIAQEAQKLVVQRQSEFDAAKSLAERGFNSRIRLNEAAAQLEAAKSSLKQASTTLGKTKITAPFNGIIQERAIEIGDFVSIGDMAFTLVHLDPVKFTGFLAEREIQEVDLNKTARIELLNSDIINAKITYISPSANEDTRTYRIEIELPNPDGLIKEGFTAKILIPTQEQMAHKISPSILTLNDIGQVGVKIVKEDDTVAFMPITILSDQSDYMWISGLPDQGKTRLISVGQEFVQDGQKVKPVLSTAEGAL